MVNKNYSNISSIASDIQRKKGRKKPGITLKKFDFRCSSFLQSLNKEHCQLASQLKTTPQVFTPACVD